MLILVKASFEIKADEVNIVISNTVAFNRQGTGGARMANWHMYTMTFDQYESIRS